MWIKASERKPDSTRRVFVRGNHSKYNREMLATAHWLDFDERWAGVEILERVDTAISPSIEYWCEIDDFLTPVVSTSQDKMKIDVPVPEFKMGQQVKFKNIESKISRIIGIDCTVQIQDNGDGFMSFASTYRYFTNNGSAFWEDEIELMEEPNVD